MAIIAVAAFSFVLTWILARAVDVVVGFADTESYAAVPGQEEEHAYDFRTARRLEALTSGGRGPDPETLAAIQWLLRDHRDAG
ncbi:ammonium transporter [Streptomyces sp. NPDC006012]|uniref:ammonium transporter n=1 Tax=Streptomyces sp. NPDC006012 TaxID=3364739 RepID=UPI00369399D2